MFGDLSVGVTAFGRVRCYCRAFEISGTIKAEKDPHAMFLGEDTFRVVEHALDVYGMKHLFPRKGYPLHDDNLLWYVNHAREMLYYEAQERRFKVHLRAEVQHALGYWEALY